MQQDAGTAEQQKAKKQGRDDHIKQSSIQPPTLLSFFVKGPALWKVTDNLAFVPATSIIEPAYIHVIYILYHECCNWLPNGSQAFIFRVHYNPLNWTL